MFSLAVAGNMWQPAEPHVVCGCLLQLRSSSVNKRPPSFWRGGYF
jgi:hypothetical protein